MSSRQLPKSLNDWLGVGIALIGLVVMLSATTQKMTRRTVKIRKVKPLIAAEGITSLVDHTALSQVLSEQEVHSLCAEAIKYNFASVCIPPYFVPLAAKLLENTPIRVSTVIGFPQGYAMADSKAEEIILAYESGADEVDVVANVAAIRAHDWDTVAKEAEILERAVNMCPGVTYKLIVESGLLSEEEIIQCCYYYGTRGLHYMKTSTGFAPKGASVDAVATMRKYLPQTVGIKASGGIRTIEFAKELVGVGATRLGCSAGVSIAEAELNNAKVEVKPGSY